MFKSSGILCTGKKTVAPLSQFLPTHLPLEQLEAGVALEGHLPARFAVLHPPVFAQRIRPAVRGRTARTVEPGFRRAMPPLVPRQAALRREPLPTCPAQELLLRFVGRRGLSLHLLCFRLLLLLLLKSQQISEIEPRGDAAALLAHSRSWSSTFAVSGYGGSFRDFGWAVSGAKQTDQVADASTADARTTHGDGDAQASGKRAQRSEH